MFYENVFPWAQEKDTSKFTSPEHNFYHQPLAKYGALSHMTSHPKQNNGPNNGPYYNFSVPKRYAESMDNLPSLMGLPPISPNQPIFGPVRPGPSMSGPSITIAEAYPISKTGGPFCSPLVNLRDRIHLRLLLGLIPLMT